MLYPAPACNPIHSTDVVGSIRIDEDEVRARDVSALADFAHPWVRHRLGAAPPSSNVGRGTIPPRCQWLTFFTNREKAVQTPADVACTDDEENYDGHHYKLLSVLAASHRDQLIVDVGTGYGLSALALSVEPSNIVVSIDKVDLVTRAQHFAKVNSVDISACHVVMAYSYGPI